MVRKVLIAALIPSLSVSNVANNQARIIDDSHQVSSTFHMQFNASRRMPINLENFAGNIVVETWDKPTVEIDGVKYGPDDSEVKATRVTARLAGTQLSIKTAYGIPADKEGFASLRGGTVDYVLRVPANSPIKVVDGSGSVVGKMLEPDVAISTIDGNISLSLRSSSRRCKITLNAKKGNINIAIANITSASISAKTAIGRVTSDRILKESSDETGQSASGNIGSSYGSIELMTELGDIRVSA